MHRTSWRAALLVAVALVAAACGRGGDEADGTPDTPAGDAGAEEDLGEPDDEPAAAEPQSVTYEVQDGDTLSGIAVEHDVSVDDIVAANDLDDPDEIYPGDVIEIPVQPGGADADDPEGAEGAGSDADDSGADDDAGAGDG